MQFYFKLFYLAWFICLHLFCMSNSSIWPMNRLLSGATTPGQNGPRSDIDEVLFCIPQSLKITGASPWNCLMSYTEHPKWRDIAPQQSCSRCILQNQPNCLTNKTSKTCWSLQQDCCKDELKSDIIQWIPRHGHTSVDRQTKTYINQLNWTLCPI